jgi:hypothetical protein
VKIGGGVETVRQYLRAGLIDELHFALSPVVLGQGEAFAGIDLPALSYRVTEHQATEHATHIVLSREESPGPVQVRRALADSALPGDCRLQKNLASPRGLEPRSSP